MMGVHRALIRAFHRFAVGGEFTMCHLISKLIAVRLEKHVNPSDMMLCGVGVGNFFADGHLDIKHFFGFHGIRAFNDGNVLFAFSLFQSAV